MSLFQKSVEKKYLAELDSLLIDKKYNTLQAYFGNIEIQENIRNSKEEQFQEGFLRELFVNILDYTLNPEPNFNLTTELKNIKGSKKADGAILNEENAIAVIELKSTLTTDLDSVEDQAFGYKNHHPKCIYVITSNFEKLRFYIQNAIEYIEFDLFNLSKEKFTLLWLCLSKDNILKDLPLKIKESSVLQEENITKKLYADYSKFKKAIFNNIVKNHSDKDKLLLFKKTQKLLDRFLFVFFAEDRLLLPPNSISEIVKQWSDLKDKYDEYFPLYDRFKKYFGYMNTGFKGKQYDIYPYNGGLFFPDETLDNLTLDDDTLYEHTLKLSTYDFDTEIDVNILGHIFEHSLTEIENVQAEIKGKTVDRQKSKRKKDGIFYTPKYITKYIVENTVGKLCFEKRSELKIIDEDFLLNHKKATKKRLLDKLETYRKWLLDITILDPACGSGAFLNQALEFLIEEHHKIDTLKTKLLGGGLVFSDIETGILENNIHGVDINEESVEIAKLSLWLRTARKGRKLNTLSNNIKCGNSLIDDPEVAGEKAFNWEKEFPKIFADGGFDVVIGNPPYVRQELLKSIKPYLKKSFECFNSVSDLYTYFFEKGIKLLKDKGLLGYIAPNKFINSNYGRNLRKFLTQFRIRKIIDFGELPVFEEASTFPAIYLIDNSERLSQTIYSKITDLNFTELRIEIEKNKLSSTINNDKWEFFEETEINILNKLSNNTISLKEYVNGDIKFGIKTGFNEAYVIDKNKKAELIAEDPKSIDIIYPFIDGDHVRNYRNEFRDKYIIAAKMGVDLSGYTAIMNHFKFYKEKLEKRSDKSEKWYQLRACSYYNYFEKPKIWYPDIALEPRFSFDDSGIYPNATLFVIPKADKYLLSILNSKVAWFFFSRNCPVIGDIKKRGRLRLKTAYISKLPIKNIPQEKKQQFIVLVDKILLLNIQLQEKKNKYLGLLTDNLKVKKYSNKLESFYDFDFKIFLAELRKLKINLSLNDQAEWKSFFLQYKSEINNLQSEISKMDYEIDQLVYKLYCLTEEEIKIIEDSI